MSRAASTETGRSALLWTLIATCSLVLGVPILFILLSGFRGPAEFLPFEANASWTLSNFVSFYLDQRLYREVLPNTLLFAFGSLIPAAALAIFLAWVFERIDSRQRTIIQILILAPLALPAPAIALSWIRLLGPNAGLINEMLKAITGSSVAPLNIFSMPGLIWCQTLAAVPVCYLLLAPAIRAVRIDLEESAYVCGAKPGSTFLRVGLPLASRSLIGPLLILSIASLEQVDLPYILGPTANITVYGTRILEDLLSPHGLPNLGAISAAATSILALSLVGILIHGRLSNYTRPSGVSTRRQSGTRHTRSRLHAVACAALLFYLIAALLLPLCVLLIDSLGILNRHHAISNGWVEIWRDSRFWRALWNTFIVATLSALVGSGIGTSIAVCAYGGKNRLGRALDMFSTSSVAIPPIIVALGASMIFLSIPVGIYGTIGLLVFAYSYRIAVATRMVDGFLSQIGPSAQESARMCGASWGRTQTTIVIPMVRPSIIASGAFLFVVGVKEFTIPLLLYSPDNVVLSVMLLQMNQAGLPSSAAATSLLMTTLALVGIVVLAVADSRISSLQRIP